MNKIMTQNWLPAARVEDLDPDYPTQVKLAGMELALCLSGDEVYALANICSHAFARLSDGYIEGHEVFCPLHSGSFDIRTGAACAAPCVEPVQSFPVKVEGGQVFVDCGGV